MTLVYKEFYVSVTSWKGLKGALCSRSVALTVEHCVYPWGLTSHFNTFLPHEKICKADFSEYLKTCNVYILVYLPTVFCPPSCITFICRSVGKKSETICRSVDCNASELVHWTQWSWVWRTLNSRTKPDYCQDVSKSQHKTLICKQSDASWGRGDVGTAEARNKREVELALKVRGVMIPPPQSNN